MNGKVLAIAATVLLSFAAPDIANATGGRGGGHGGGHRGHFHGGRFHGGLSHGHGHKPFHGGHGHKDFHGGHGHKPLHGHGDTRFHGGHGKHFHAHPGHLHSSTVIAVTPWWWNAPPVVYGPSRPQSYWYFCASAGAYYPYVQTCPEAWIPVLP